MSISIRAYAKINLLLDILSKLDNGYHEVFNIMQSVGLYDDVTVSPDNSGNISVSCNNSDIPSDDKNIAHKATVAFFEKTDIEKCGINISIEKNIPHCAGLGGGSADAAAVIIALDRLFGTKLDEKSIISIASEVGADVPFCALGGTMLAQYTGALVTHLPDLDERYVVIVKPDEKISTSDAYSSFDNAERVRHLDTRNMLFAVIENNWKTVSEKVGNVFEQFIEVTDRAVIKGIMRRHHCLCTCMSGSGPSIFGIFDTKEEAEACLCEVKKSFCDSYLCTTVNKGFLIL